MKNAGVDSAVVVTGVGVISALGRGYGRHVEAVRNAESGLVSLNLFNGTPPDPVLCGRVPGDILNPDLEATASHRATSLLNMALADALADAGLAGDAAVEADLLVGTTLGNMHGGTLYHRQLRSGGEPDPGLVRDFLPCAPAHSAAREAGLTGSVRTVASACGSASAAIGQALRRLRQGRAKRVVAGGFEALSPYCVAGFASLKLIASGPCRPLDAGRDGLNPGEAAALLVLETEDEARRRGARPLGRLSGYGEALEAYHQTRADPDGAGVAAALGRCLAMADAAPEQVSCLHLHGTATRANDISEHAACRAVWGEDLASLPVCSTKPMTGHTFGAAGALGAIFSLITLDQGVAPGTLNLTDPDPALAGFNAAAGPREIPAPEHVASVALGFGGESYALCLSRAKREGGHG